MRNTLEDHPGIATAGVILIAVAVVVLLSFLSTRSSSKGSQPIFAHGQQGPVEQLPADQRQIKDETGQPAAVTSAANEPATSTAATGEPADWQAAAPAGGIRQMDFNSVLADELGGGATLEQTLYVDLDGNGSPEAIVLIRGAGENRPMAWKVFAEDGGGVRMVFERSGVSQGELTVDGPRVVETEGVFTESDQPCCPSSLKKTYYVWKAGGLVVSKVEVQPAI